MIFSEDKESRIQHIELSEIKDSGVSLYIKREDELHTFVSGNKFRKLKYNIFEAQKQNKKVLLTFGGAYSNHIAATASAGNLCGFKTIGIIRGEELANDLEKILATNPTLKFAVENGMQLEFVTRSAYREKNTDEFIQKLKEKFGDFYLVPEGGTNNLAVKGCEEILTEKDAEFDYICCAIGTGGTISGIINSTKEHQKVLGFPALKGAFLQNDIKKLINNKKENWQLIHNYNFGGYGKINKELIIFINNFIFQTNIPLDPVYTGKMVFGVVDLIKQNYFKEGSKILLIHSGGLQGIEGMNKLLTKKNLPLINFNPK
ncbi:1-aminocyclopropane-1-carboxylate deaminase/D-cysteine desulfhydrase [Aureivirga sp. CE67]|uniref:1-aminocyclopropane-1-carboxylate deaminase/D-cysteine desulfhydrase n=1 Tax=Aureivirga sp. CE67 TaxID=1788983 RepID=UPI0018CA6019|nr:pyridoxal-phosphate dependent enzyme [Aureivirga sp. CE67]